MVLDEFLKEFFHEEKYAELRRSAKSFAAGFDLAPSAAVSVQSLYREWSEEMGTQYRIDGGYKQLVDYLERCAKNNGVTINTGCCAKKISWQTNEVNVATMCSRFFRADKVIIAIPVSVLQAGTNSEDYIEFLPAIPQHLQAAKDIGFGGVLKVIFEFETNFWNEKQSDAGMMFTQEDIPTWWSQLPVQNNVLTGWAGGAKAIALQHKSDDEIRTVALRSLSNAFAIPVGKLTSILKASKIANWNKVPDINGGYSYNTINSVRAKQILRKPVNDTIYFTGEALFEGMPGGTVEAALSSARNTVAQILESY